MRLSLLVSLCVVGACLLGAQAADKPADKKADEAAGKASPAAETKLLDKGLDGFRYYLADHGAGMEDVWSLRDGILTCKGEPMGYLYTKKAYKNVRVRVEYRWPPGVKPTNSGVFLRINGNPRPLPRCVEAQLQAGNAGDFYGFQGMKLSGDAARLKSVKGHELGGDLTGVKKIEANEKPAGEWNTYEIRAEGPRLKVWLNGKLVNEATDVEEVAGPIALQSEGGEVQFRNLVVEPLPD
jgi:hypothetical protein